MVRVDSEIKVQNVHSEGSEVKKKVPNNVVPMVSDKTESIDNGVSLGNTRQKVDVKVHTLDYSNFGGKKEASAAADFASEVVDVVNDSLRQLQRNYPGAKVELDDFPDPKDFSKKTFGKNEAYNQWKQEVRAWRENSMAAINAYADKSHKEVVNDAASHIEGKIDEASDKINDKIDSAYEKLEAADKQILDKFIELEQITKDGFEELAKQLNYDMKKVIRCISQAVKDVKKNNDINTQKIIRTVQEDGRLTRFAGRIEGRVTRGTVREEGARTRNDVSVEGHKTRGTVRKEGARTRNQVIVEGDMTRNAVRKEHDNEQSFPARVLRRAKEIIAGI